MKTETSNRNALMIALPIILIMGAQIGTTTDNVVLGISTLDLVETLGVTLGEIQLANMVYAMVAGSLMIIGGMLGIVIGWKRNYQLGALFACIGELSVAFAPNVEVLTWVGRALVGIGGSLLIPSAIGMIPALFKGRQRAQAFGAVAIAIGLGNFIPLIAGYAIDAFGWRKVFLFLAFYFGTLLLVSSAMPAVPRTGDKVKMDIVGSLLVAASLFSILVSLAKINTWGAFAAKDAPFTIFGLSPALPLMLIGVGLIAVLVPYERNFERKHQAALIPSSFVKTPQVRNGLYGLLLMFFCFGGYGIVVNPFLQLVGGFSASQLGIATVIMNFPVIVVSWFVPKYLGNLSQKQLVRAGIIIMAASSLVIAWSFGLHEVSSVYIIGFLLSGIAQGIVLTVAPNVVATAVNVRDSQQSSGVQATSRNIGKSVGIALLGTVLIFNTSLAFSSKIAGSEMSPEAQTSISSTVAGFVSDKDFNEAITDAGLTEEEARVAFDANAQARLSAARNTMYLMTIVTLLALLGTRKITGTIREA